MNLTEAVLAIVLATLLIGCSSNSVDSEPEESEGLDTISGVYFLHGTKINQDVCWIPIKCEEGEPISSDTLDIAFTVNVEWIEERQDTLKFIGLEGANTGVRHVLYPPICIYPRDCAFAKLTDTEFEMDLLTSAGRYSGTGTLREGTLTLDTEFSYRTVLIKYDLTGPKIIGVE